MIPLIYFAFGGLGFAASIYYPIKKDLDKEHAAWIGVGGFAWVILCIYAAYHI